MITRGFLPLLAIVAAGGIAALAWETDGFRVVTSAGARQLSIERNPVRLPDVRLALSASKGPIARCRFERSDRSRLA